MPAKSIENQILNAMQLRMWMAFIARSRRNNALLYLTCGLVATMQRLEAENRVRRLPHPAAPIIECKSTT
jgi:hypothetical protein